MFRTQSFTTQVAGESEASQRLDGREWTFGTFVNSSGAQDQSVRGQSLQLPAQGWVPLTGSTWRFCFAAVPMVLALPGPGFALCAESPQHLEQGRANAMGSVGLLSPPAHLSPQVGDQGRDRSGQAAAGAQQGQHRLFLVPVLGFLPSSICISLIPLLFGHLGLIPVFGGSLSHWLL